MVVFAVPERFRPSAPEVAAAAGLCPRCLVLTAVDDDASVDPDFERIIEGFPTGEEGASLALAIGLLVDSLVMHRTDIERLFDATSDAGVDPWLVLERLAIAGSVQPDADLFTLRQQLEQLTR